MGTFYGNRTTREGAAHRVLIEPSLDDPCTALCVIDRAPKPRALCEELLVPLAGEQHSRENNRLAKNGTQLCTIVSYKLFCDGSRPIHYPNRAL
jgi:hypothetical protein